MRKTKTLMATAALAMALLAGCSGNDGGSGTSGDSAGTGPQKEAPAEAAPEAKPQTKAQACKIAKDDLEPVIAKLSTGGNVQTDPKGTAKKMRAIDDAFKTTAAKLTNAQVKDELTKTSAALGKVIPPLDTYADDPSAKNKEKMAPAVEKMTEQLGKMGDTCDW